MRRTAARRGWWPLCTHRSAPRRRPGDRSASTMPSGSIGRSGPTTGCCSRPRALVVRLARPHPGPRLLAGWHPGGHAWPRRCFLRRPRASTATLRRHDGPKLKNRLVPICSSSPGRCARLLAGGLRRLQLLGRVVGDHRALGHLGHSRRPLGERATATSSSPPRARRCTFSRPTPPAGQQLHRLVRHRVAPSRRRPPLEGRAGGQSVAAVELHPK